jgi:hypothetical protein
MGKTVSEKLFEQFCVTHGIACQRIPETDGPTPDYELKCGPERVVVEVKEITLNREERESERLAAERGYGNAVSHTPGGRLRRKINDCSEQIRARTLGKRPSILVVFDRGRAAGHVDPYSVRVAMYGLEQVHLAVPPAGMGSPHAIGMGYGPKRKMTPDHNTSISAIGALVMAGPQDVRLLVYHNKFARVPLDPTLLGRHGIEQYKLGDDVPGTVALWHRIVVAPEH